MTENNTNHDAGGGEDRERVIGTPTSAGGDSIVGTADPQSEHEGPYLPEETDTRSEEMQRRGEKSAARWFVIAFLAGVAFLVAYFVFPPAVIGTPQGGQYSNMALGGTLALALFGIGAGMTAMARRVMPHYEVSSDYDELPSAPREKGSFGDFFMRGANESGVTKRPLMRRTMLLAMLPLGLAPIVLLRDTGPLPARKLHHTTWGEATKGKGMRMVVEGSHREGKATWIRAEDLANEPGGMISALPYVEPTEEHPQGLSLDQQAKDVIILIKMPDADWGPRMREDGGKRLNWTHDGIIAYSKVCTHVGCPAALYEQSSHRILCPCHQSTFDASNGAEVVFGPAHRPLPQLPISVDEEGYLVATGDFPEAVGPTFWDAEKE